MTEGSQQGKRRRIYLLRHGDVNYFQDDGTVVPRAGLAGLTEKGRRQADMVGQTLAEVEFDQAVCSGMPRTRETAERVLSHHHDVSLASHEGLREIRAGNLDQLPPERVEAEYVYAFETAIEPGARFVRGEAFSAFYSRVVKAFCQLLLSPDWQTLLVVGHAGTNRAILSWAAYGSLATFPAFEQDLCCVNIVDVDVREGEFIRRYIRLVNLSVDNLVKAGVFRTTLEQLDWERSERGSVRSTSPLQGAEGSPQSTA